MKFFYINNSQCVDCDKCANNCPTMAIYTADKKRYINYDKCTSCGNCVKSCNIGAITVETIERMLVDVEKIELYKSRIQRLENEVSSMKNRMTAQDEYFSKVILSLPLATFVADRNNRIMIANNALIEMLSIDAFRRSELTPQLVGESFDNVFTEEFASQLKMAFMEDDERFYTTKISETPISFNVVPLGNDIALVMVRDLSVPQVAFEEIVTLMRETIDRKMAMVQNIGSLLGEELSVVVNNLNTVINIAESVSDDK